jgi:AcrR family transcriptional regulator
MPDRRTFKTEKAIKEAFLSLLKTKDPNKISVTQIVNIANIGRGTFYLHYLDVLDLYEKVINEYFKKIELFFDNAFPTTNTENLKKLMRNIITFISENKDFFLCLLRLEGSEKTISKLKAIFNEKILQETIKLSANKNIETEYLNIENIFVVSGIVGVIEGWLNDGLIMQNEKIINILHKIIMKFNT